MTPEDREFIVRALAAHAALVTLKRDIPADVSIAEWAEVYRGIINDFANVKTEPKSPEPKLVRTADGREFLVRDRRAS